MQAESGNASDAPEAVSMNDFDFLLGQQKSGTLHIWGNRETMNMNTMILTNIKQSPYFKHELLEMKTFSEVVDAIYYKVNHLEPWERGSRRTAGLSGASGGGLQVRGVGAGGIVSTAYCLLYKLFTLRISRKQLQTLLDHGDSPYIRGLGFMFIRYCIDPKDYWEWFSPYLDDREEIEVKAGGGSPITIGEMLRQFLTQLDWFSTLFPRIPVPVEKDLRARLQDRQPAATAAAAAAAAKPVSPPLSQSQSGTDRREYSRARGGSDHGSRSRSRSRDTKPHHGVGSKHRDREERDRDRDRDRRREQQHEDRRSRSRDRGKDRELDRRSSHKHSGHRDKDRRDRDRVRDRDRDRDRRDR